MPESLCGCLQMTFFLLKFTRLCGRIQSFAFLFFLSASNASFSCSGSQCVVEMCSLSNHICFTGNLFRRTIRWLSELPIFYNHYFLEEIQIDRKVRKVVPSPVSLLHLPLAQDICHSQKSMWDITNVPTKPHALFGFVQCFLLFFPCPTNPPPPGHHTALNIRDSFGSSWLSVSHLSLLVTGAVLRRTGQVVGRTTLTGSCLMLL